MESAFLNVNYLVEVLSLGVLIVCFGPLIRRAGPHVNPWLSGWVFLLLHFTALLLIARQVPFGPVLQLVSRWALDLCAMTFVLSSERDQTQRIPRLLASLLALPILLQSAVAVFPQLPAALNRVAVLLFLAPGLYLVAPLQKATRQALMLGAAWLVLGTLALRFTFSNPSVPSDAALSVLFLAAAFLVLRSAPAVNRGVLATSAGLAGWGLTFPLPALASRWYPAVHVSRAVLELPIALTAIGILLVLVEDHVLITERRATHDALTNLPNLRMFEERFAAALEEARQEHTTIACLVIDVDNFKTINDTLGHAAGDELLKSLAVRLAWHLTPRDLLARTGGDEFTVLLAGVTDEHHLRFVAGSMMSASSVPLLLEGKPVDVRISVGIALSPDHADDTEGLRRAADLAMYSAKRRGGSLLAYAGEE